METAAAVTGGTLRAGEEEVEAAALEAVPREVANRLAASTAAFKFVRLLPLPLLLLLLLDVRRADVSESRDAYVVMGVAASGVRGTMLDHATPTAPLVSTTVTLTSTGSGEVEEEERKKLERDSAVLEPPVRPVV